MATSLSLGAILGGRIEPTRIVVKRPALALTREADGTISFTVGAGDSAAGQPDFDNLLGMFIPPQPDTPWGRLSRIEVRDATVVVNDRETGKVWRASHAGATLERSGDAVTGDVSLAVALGDNVPELHGSYRIGPARKLDVSLAVDGLDPAALAAMSPALAPLADAQFTVSGTAGLRFDLASGTALGGRVDLGFGAGQIRTDLLASGQLPVRQGELHADYDPDNGELRLERLAIDLHGGTTIVVDGTLGGLQPRLVGSGAWPKDLAGTLGVTLAHVPVARLAGLWPRNVSPGGRKWAAANLSDGMLDEMAVQFAVALDPAAMTADFSGARGTMRYHDLTVDYFDGLPPAKKVSGTAALNDRRLDFALTGGTVKSLKATGGALSVTNIGAPVETLAVDVGVAGPLQDALDIIDAKPLRYAHEAGIDPARAGGKVDAQLHFSLPLLNELKLADIDYGAKAALSGVSYAKVAFDRPLTDGNFALDLGHDGVHAKGSGKFDGAAATFDGNLYFHPKTGPRSLYRIALALDDAARQRLGWGSLGGRLNGPVAVDLTYTVPNHSGPAQVVAALDLTAATLSCDEAGWKKPPHAPGSAKLVATLNDDVVTAIPDVAVKAAGLDVRFDVALDPAGHNVDRVDIRRLVIADDDIAGTVTRRAGGGWQADMHGARLNLHRVLKRALENDAPGDTVPLAINARIARLMLGPHREAREVSATLSRGHTGWQAMRIDGSYSNGRRFAFTLGGSDAARKLHLQSDDLGATFALFGIADNVAGGRLTVDGTVGEAAGHHVIRAHIDGADYALQRAPALARLLSLASLDGIAGVMTGAGIPFTTLRGDVSFSRGVISLQRVVAYGGALGISAKGWLNPGEDQIDVDGTLAPAYALNSVLGNVPVIGALLTGGEGQGLFAASFRLTGSNDDPSVTVNPLSALTPGLLRHLFDPFTAPAGPAPPPQ
ncbi:MAG TPA: AsmA-like C-terminal region-containing protein [Stellaceae bacterium]|nr:AsmA-like C-terminal region-containing protein [Stellaceae bacterium]